MIKHVIKYRLEISVFLLVLVHFSGLLGITLGDKKWFLSATPLNLLLTCILLLWNLWKPSVKEFIFLSIAFLTGMISEMLGANFGFIFGTYSYGNNLGLKVYNVPWLIGVNWMVLSYLSASISNSIMDNRLLRLLFAGFLMVFMDWLIEPVAPLFDFWYWKNDYVPLQNYCGWFIVSLIPQIYYVLFVKENRAPVFSFILFVVQMLFFSFLIQ